MAQLRISDDLIKLNPDVLTILSEYFDSMEEMTRETANIKRYAVQKKGLPTDDTDVVCTISNDKVVSCK